MKVTHKEAKKIFEDAEKRGAEVGGELG